MQEALKVAKGLTNEARKNWYIVFLGDIVDRGPDQIQCLLIALSLVNIFPNNAVYLRGNHECMSMHNKYGFNAACLQADPTESVTLIYN